MIFVTTRIHLQFLIKHSIYLKQKKGNVTHLTLTRKGTTLHLEREREGAGVSEELTA